MQDRYCCDIGDYAKCGLLRAIIPNDLKLGINWYRVDPYELGEAKINDGRHLDYLKDKSKFSECDPLLYKSFQNIIRKCDSGHQKRSVSLLEKDGGFPRSAIFYHDLLSYRKAKGKKDRLEDREKWAQAGLDVLSRCHIVFFDPDNGLEVKSCPKHKPKSIKYIFHDEVIEYYESGKSLIIYQHRDRSPQPKYFQKFKGLVEKLLPKPADIFLLRWNAYSVRDHVFIVQAAHKDKILSKLNEMQKSPWFKNNLFKIIRI